MDSVTTGFSLYIDQYLQPIVRQLQSYIRDGTHLLELLSPYRWEPTYVQLSLDVNSLYTSIPHSFGLMALEHFLAQDPLINPPQAAFILEATTFCLTHNYFYFNEDFYICNNKAQQRGQILPHHMQIWLWVFGRLTISLKKILSWPTSSL